MSPDTLWQGSELRSPEFYCNNLRGLRWLASSSSRAFRTHVGLVLLLWHWRIWTKSISKVITTTCRIATGGISVIERIVFLSQSPEGMDIEHWQRHDARTMLLFEWLGMEIIDSDQRGKCCESTWAWLALLLALSDIVFVQSIHLFVLFPQANCHRLPLYLDSMSASSNYRPFGLTVQVKPSRPWFLPCRRWWFRLLPAEMSRDLWRTALWHL